MNEVEKEFAIHQAICDQRYKAIEDKLESGKKRMEKIEIQLYIVIAAIGKAIDKARRLQKGAVIRDRLDRVAPLATSPTKINSSGGGSLRLPAGASNSPLPRTAPVANAPVAMNATSKGSRRAPGGFSAGLRGGSGTLRIQPNVEKLSPSEAASLKMLESSLVAQELDPKQNDDYTLLQEILGRKQLVDPEQNRLKALFRRMDNLYHPETVTLGGADHWSDDPSARLAGRAHVSVNIHHAYVQIPAAIQAVRPVINYVPTGQTPEDRQAAQWREQIYFRWWEANDMDLQLEQAALLKELYGHTAAKVYWDPIERVPKITIIERLALALDVDRARLHRLHPSARLNAISADVLKRKGQRRDRISTLLRYKEFTAGGKDLEVTRADDVGDDVQIVRV